MLSRLRRVEPSSACLGVVVAFGLVAALLSARTLGDTRAVGAEFRGTITPAFAAADGDPAVAALLERTGMVSEDFAVAMLPIAEALGRAADATTAGAKDTASIRDHVGSIRTAFEAADGSAATVETLVAALAPAVVAVMDGTGDIGTRLAKASQQSRQASRLLERVLAELRGITNDAGSLRERTKAIEDALERIERRSSSIAAADALNCPADLRSCLP